MSEAEVPPPTGSGPRRSGLRRWLVGVFRLAASVAFVVAIAWWIDLATVVERLRSIHLGWFALSCACMLPIFTAMAARWCIIARRLDLDLPFWHALREYFGANLVNQIVPGGIAGDVLRVVRHGSDARQRGGTMGRAAQAVVLERMSGQVVLWALVVCVLPGWARTIRLEFDWITATVPVVVIVVIVGGYGLLTRSRHRYAGHLKAMVSDSRRALLSGPAGFWIVLTSLLPVVGFVAMYECAARSVGDTIAFWDVVRVVPLLLGATTLPLVFSGWGLREASNAALYTALGLSAADGTATSIVFGLAALVGALPGAPLLLLGRSPEPTR